MVHQDHALLLDCYRLLHHLSFSIELAQAEIISGQFRCQDELNVLQIGRRALQVSVGGLQVLPVPSEEIDFVVKSERNLVRRSG